LCDLWGDVDEGAACGGVEGEFLAVVFHKGDGGLREFCGLFFFGGVRGCRA
jgi:hypothetical protein